MPSTANATVKCASWPIINVNSATRQSSSRFFSSKVYPKQPWNGYHQQPHSLPWCHYANVKNLRLWIKHDVAEADERPVDDMYAQLLQRASSNPRATEPDSELLPRCLKAVLKVCNNEPKIHEALVKYVRSGNEKAYYSPFIDAAETTRTLYRNFTRTGSPYGNPTSSSFPFPTRPFH